MYAVIATGGKQYRVTKDAVLKVEKLDALPGREPEAAVGVVVCSRVECEPLRGSELARGNLDPHHEDEIAVFLAAFVALALFVNAEVLGDFLGVLGDGLGFARAQRVDLRSHRMPALVRRVDVEQSFAREL